MVARDSIATANVREQHIAETIPNIYTIAHIIPILPDRHVNITNLTESDAPRSQVVHPHDYLK